jgi:hypothetical protein
MKGAMRSPFALKIAPVEFRSRLLAVLAAPTGGTLPREEPENASPLDVPETDAPEVWPEVGFREDPLNASPDEVPEIDAPVVVPGVPVAEPPGTLVVAGVEAPPGAIGRAAEFTWAWAAVPASASATDVAIDTGFSARIEVSLGADYGLLDTLPPRGPLRH